MSTVSEQREISCSPMHYSHRHTKKVGDVCLSFFWGGGYVLRLSQVWGSKGVKYHRR